MAKQFSEFLRFPISSTALKQVLVNPLRSAKEVSLNSLTLVDNKLRVFANFIFSKIELLPFPLRMKSARVLSAIMVGFSFGLMPVNAVAETNSSKASYSQGSSSVERKSDSDEIPLPPAVYPGPGVISGELENGKLLVIKNTFNTSKGISSINSPEVPNANVTAQAADLTLRWYTYDTLTLEGNPINILRRERRYPIPTLKVVIPENELIAAGFNVTSLYYMQNILYITVLQYGWRVDPSGSTAVGFIQPNVHPKTSKRITNNGVNSWEFMVELSDYYPGTNNINNGFLAWPLYNNLTQFFVRNISQSDSTTSVSAWINGGMYWISNDRSVGIHNLPNTMRNSASSWGNQPLYFSSENQAPNWIFPQK